MNAAMRMLIIDIDESIDKLLQEKDDVWAVEFLEELRAYIAELNEAHALRKARLSGARQASYLTRF